MMSLAELAPPVLERSVRRSRTENTRAENARTAKRARARARVEAAERRAPSLRTDRAGPLLALLRTYRERDFDLGASTPLARYVGELRREVEALEDWASARGRRAHNEGDAIRQALGFLQTFGRLTSLDFSAIPVEEREGLVALLALEHRFCYAAAGTTRDAFKIAIGRTGAR